MVTYFGIGFVAECASLPSSRAASGLKGFVPPSIKNNNENIASRRKRQGMQNAKRATEPMSFMRVIGVINAKNENNIEPLIMEVTNRMEDRRNFLKSVAPISRDSGGMEACVGKSFSSK